MLTIDLTDRVILVLGGSRGIGAGIVEALCRAGAAVVFTWRGEAGREQADEELLARIRSLGGRVSAVKADACDSAQTARAVRETHDAHGRIDGLVCNVGQTLRRPLEQADDASWHRFLEVNLGSAFFAVREVVPHMAGAGYGKIVFIGSSAVFDGGGGAIDYASAKAGLVGMMNYLTRNYASRGIRANVIHPCVIDTDLLREGYDTEEKRRQLAAQVPVGRLGRVEDIAGLAAFLISPLGDFICGQSILVDGGRTFF